MEKGVGGCSVSFRNNVSGKTAKTGAVSEYAEIEETMSPVALQKIARWILKQ